MGIVCCYFAVSCDVDIYANLLTCGSRVCRCVWGPFVHMVWISLLQGKEVEEGNERNWK